MFHDKFHAVLIVLKKLDTIFFTEFGFFSIREGLLDVSRTNWRPGLVLAESSLLRSDVSVTVAGQTENH
jgi:hypothetical protein